MEDEEHGDTDDEHMEDHEYDDANGNASDNE